MRNANLKTEYIVADASPQAAQHFWQENYRTYYTGIAANIYLQKKITDTLTKKSFEHVIVDVAANTHVRTKKFGQADKSSKRICIL